MVSHDDLIYLDENVQVIILTRKIIPLAVKNPRITLNYTQPTSQERMTCDPQRGVKEEQRGSNVTDNR